MYIIISTNNLHDVHTCYHFYIYNMYMRVVFHHFNTTLFKGSSPNEATTSPKVQQAFSEPAPPKRQVLRTLREERGAHERR